VIRNVTRSIRSKESRRSTLDRALTRGGAARLGAPFTSPARAVSEALAAAVALLPLTTRSPRELAHLRTLASIVFGRRDRETERLLSCLLGDRPAVPYNRDT
jgi:hypothetical protein